MEWKPIETAPKDGTNILVYGKESGVKLVAWLNDATGYKAKPYYTWCVPDSWQDEQGGYTIYGDHTHWMELPTPPCDGK